MLQSDGTYVAAAAGVPSGAAGVNSQQLLLDSYTKPPALAE